MEGKKRKGKVSFRCFLRDYDFIGSNRMIGFPLRFEKLLMTDLRKEDVNDVYVRVKSMIRLSVVYLFITIVSSIIELNVECCFLSMD